MRIHNFALWSASLAAAARALVVPQQVLDTAGQALSWTGSSADADSDVHTNTVWSYVDCGMHQKGTQD